MTDRPTTAEGIAEVEVEAVLDARLARLSLSEKVLLLTGQDHWRTAGSDLIGLSPVVFSDGPVGVRGQVWDERAPSLNLPSSTVLAATWDAALARAFGRVLAGEARRSGVHVVLAPTVNLHRSPLAGRCFEAFSEDPLLTGHLAAALVSGLQECGVGACVKHYVANDAETERFTVSSEVSERSLRELYLRAFERPVVDAGAWTVMSAYNAVNGVTATQSPLLTSPLKDEWGFDGLVVSDWTAVRSVSAAAGGQDLVMPGPRGPWGEALVAAVRDGEVPEAAVEDKVRRLLRLAARVGALAGAEPPAPAVAVPDVASGQALARQVAADGTVLLTNSGLLPLAADRLRRVAVLGSNAAVARTQGGGSATVLPVATVSPLEGLRAALPGVGVDHALGAVVQAGVAPLPLDQLTHPLTGAPGARVRFLDTGGAAVHEEHRLTTDLVWFGGDAPLSETARVEVSFGWTPEHSGVVRLGFAAVGLARLRVDGRELLAAHGEVAVPRLGASPLAPPSVAVPLEVRAGTSVRVVFTLALTDESRGPAGLLALRVGLEPPDTEPEVLVEEAAGLARTADVAVVVVGTGPDVESEGFDRTTLALPGHQDALVAAVAATGTPTIVVVNSGAPVLMPWRDQVAAVVVPSFGGQELGHALADVLLGRTEPGGRLPTTWPDDDDPPVRDVTPVDGRLEYREGIHVGYRAWLAAGRSPAFPFGHGLGYTTWELTDLDVTPPGAGGQRADGRVELEVRNTGGRTGKQVVQVYLARRSSGIDRPARWLAGFAVVRCAAGESRHVTVPLPVRVLEHWDVARGWQVEPGRYEVHVGTSATDLPLTGGIAVG